MCASVEPEARLEVEAETVTGAEEVVMHGTVVVKVTVEATSVTVSVLNVLQTCLLQEVIVTTAVDFLETVVKYSETVREIGDLVAWL